MEKREENSFVYNTNLHKGRPCKASLAQEEKTACFCFESDDDSAEKIRLENTKKKLARGCLGNATICAILVAYTFLGAVVFLAIEGGRALLPHKAQGLGRPANVSRARAGEESRLETVENIWEITVSLNILYKENWTRLAGQEIARFQEAVVRRLAEESIHQPEEPKIDWTLANAFLYSLTVLTTVGYGKLAPRTDIGKAVTMGYAALGIPLVLLYLSSMGSLLSSCARNVFSRSLCCCLCSNCGYCCYDEERMRDKERRMREKREKKELERQEPFLVGAVRRSELCQTTGERATPPPQAPDSLAPLLLCLVVMVLYIGGGALLVCSLEASFTFLDGVFFCFMILSTIGLGDCGAEGRRPGGEPAVWFCCSYILCGLALTAMCFSVVHEEISRRLKRHYLIASKPHQPPSESDYLGVS